MTLRPATVRVAARAPPVFGVTVTRTEPLPVPLSPAVILIQAALLLAVHAQPLAAVTVMVRPSPFTATVFRVGDTV